MAAYRRVMTHVTCRLTAKNRDDLRNTMLGNRVWATFTFFICMLFYRRAIVVVWGYSCRSGIPGTSFNDVIDFICFERR